MFICKKALDHGCRVLQKLLDAGVKMYCSVDTFYELELADYLENKHLDTEKHALLYNLIRSLVSRMDFL